MIWLHVSLLFLLFTSNTNCDQFYRGPADKSQETFTEWWATFQEWREEVSATLDLGLYDNPDVKWARTSFLQPQLMIHDRFLYDKTTGQWTVGKYMEDVRRRYGGIDSVLLWGSYPNIGIDDRNQFEMAESVPGGMDGLKQLVSDFHEEGVKVLLPYNPWDQFTKNTGKPDYVTLIDQIVGSGADGFNGDTMDGVNQTWWEESVSRGHPIVIEPEILFHNYSYLSYNAMSWGYWTPGAKGEDEVTPFVGAYKAVTGGRHMTHVTERWARHHEDGVQQAFFNGGGFEVWENVWGIWNGITERDGEAIRRTSAILREFGDLVQGGDWVPHIPVTAENNKVFASQFTDGVKKIWLFVNRGGEAEEVVELDLPCNDIPLESLDNLWFIDLYHGEVIEEAICDPESGHSWFTTITIEPEGYGAVLLTENKDEELESFIALMADMSKLPLSEYDDEWRPLQQVIEDIQPSIYEQKPFQIDDDFLLVEGGFLPFFVVGNCIEGDRLPDALDVQFPWEDHPQRIHSQVLEVPSLYVDKYPVTNKNYKQFLEESGWQPKTTQNWLRDWNSDLVSYPEGWENKPVTWVSLQDAATYCAFYSKRLPASWEWQWAAQGSTSWAYPWGDEPDESKVPTFKSERDMPPPDDVDAHPAGASWAGIEDLVGNVYQWTSVFTDDHTSRAVLRGGSHWRPNGLDMLNSWYMPVPWGEHKGEWNKPGWSTPGPLYEHNTYLLFDEGLDRSGGIGFRCVADVKEE